MVWLEEMELERQHWLKCFPGNYTSDMKYLFLKKNVFLLVWKMNQ